jgi:hypothetical protein
MTAHLCRQRAAARRWLRTGRSPRPSPWPAVTRSAEAPEATCSMTTSWALWVTVQRGWCRCGSPRRPACSATRRPAAVARPYISCGRKIACHERAGRFAGRPATTQGPPAQARPDANQHVSAGTAGNSDAARRRRARDDTNRQTCRDYRGPLRHARGDAGQRLTRAQTRRKPPAGCQPAGASDRFSAPRSWVFVLLGGATL